MKCLKFTRIKRHGPNLHCCPMALVSLLITTSCLSVLCDTKAATAGDCPPLPKLNVLPGRGWCNLRNKGTKVYKYDIYIYHIYVNTIYVWLLYILMQRWDKFSVSRTKNAKWRQTDFFSYPIPPLLYPSMRATSNYLLKLLIRGKIILVWLPSKYNNYYLIQVHLIVCDWFWCKN